MVKLTRLKDVRQRKALTQQQLAEKAGVNRVTIARIEGGKDEPFPTTRRNVADALGVEPEELLAPAADPPASEPDGGPVAAGTPDERITVRDEPEVRRLLRPIPIWHRSSRRPPISSSRSSQTPGSPWGSSSIQSTATTSTSSSEPPRACRHLTRWMHSNTSIMFGQELTRLRTQRNICDDNDTVVNLLHLATRSVGRARRIIADLARL